MTGRAERRLPEVIDCPECSSSAGVAIAYGMPGPDLVEAAKDGRIALGGCVIFEDQPDRRCLACDHQWSEQP